MIWKTTLAKIFLPLENVKKSFHLENLWEILRSSGGNLLVCFFLAASMAVNAQTSGIDGDECIKFDSCPSDQVVCATEYDGNGVLGAYVDWVNPVVTQTCTGNGNIGNFQMLFELNEQLLTEECWEFNFINRVGGNGGHIKLFSGNDGEDPKMGRSIVTTPYLVLNDNSKTSFDVHYAASKGEDYTYTIQLFLVDQAGNEIPSGDPLEVTRNQDTYTFYTQNANDQPGIYRLKYVFVYSGEAPTNANTGDTLIAVDGMLYDTGCSGGIDFVVSAPKKGFYPVGSHDLQYIATYTSPSGAVLQKTCSFNITVSALDVAITETKAANCSGVGGSFTAAANGINNSATLPIEYSINETDFQSGGTFTGLTKGTYTVTARDATGCTVQEDVIIEGLSTPAAPVVATIVHPTCAVATGSFTVTAETAMEYSIDGTNFNATGEFSGLNAGSYDVVARNADGCISEPTAVVINAQPETPAAPVVATTVHPTCAVATGSFTVTAETAMEYSIDGTNFNATGEFSGLNAGTYNVVARNADGCISEPTAVVINAQPETPAAPVVATTVHPTCVVATGSFTVTAETGMEYSIDGTNFNATGEFSGLNAGTYNVVARNTNGCISQPTAVVINTQPETPAAPVIATTVHPTCAVATGSFTVTAETAMEYSIDGTNFNATGEFSGLNEGTYNVVARNADGCISEPTAVVINAQPETPAAPVVATTVHPTCAVATGSFTVTAETGMEYSIDGTNFNATGEFSGLNDGTYNVVAKNTKGCVSEATQVIINTQPETPAAPVVATTVHPTCAVATGSFTVTAETGMEYSIDGTNFNATGEFSGLNEGTYNVVARNADGCISEPTAVVINEQPETPAAPIIATTVHPTCAVATGSFTVTAETGMEYSIDGNNFTATGEFSGLNAGTYNVVARNADKCISEPTAVVIKAQPDTPATPVVATTVQPTCAVATGSFTVTAETGMEYSIDGTNFNATGEFSGLNAGTYNVVAKNTKGCVSEATQVIINSQPETPAAPVVATTVQPTCTVATGSFTVTAETGMEYSFDGTNFNATGEFSGLNEGTYNVVARNADGCISEPTAVVINAQPETPATPVVATTVHPTCAVATGSFTVTAETAMEYSIDGTNFNATGEFSGLNAGTYNVVARNTDGCISEPTAVVINAQPETPAAPVVATTVHPTCAVATGSFTVTAETAMEYSIDGTNFNATGEFSGLNAGTYNVVARNTDGCISEPTAVVINAQPETPAAPIVATTVHPTCAVATGSFTVTAETGMEYSIDGTNFNITGVFSGLNAGTYNVVARNADGCISEPTAVVINTKPETPAAPIISVVMSPSCGETTGAFGICCDTGMDYSIDGTNFTQEPIFRDLAPGTYQVVARNADGCISDPTTVIIEPAKEIPAAPEVTSIEQPNCEVSTGSFTVSTDTGIEYSIDGTTFYSDGEFSNLNAGIYNVVARNADGCISEATEVQINAQPETPAAPVVETTVQPTCEVATGSFTVTAVSGMEYSIDGTTFNPTGEFSGLSTSTYTVVARNTAGCLSEATEVIINPAPGSPATPVVEDLLQPTCEDPTGMILLSMLDGISYSLTADDGNVVQDVDGTFTGLSAGTYRITAHNAEGCISEPITVMIEPQPQAPASPELASIEQPTCEVPTGAFTIITEAGIEYSIDGVNYQPEGTFTGLTADSVYLITARSAEGCVSEPTSVTIDPQTGSPEAPVVNSPLTLCTEDIPTSLSDQFVGEFDETGTWEDPAGTGALQNGTVDPTVLQVGTYTFNYVIQNGACSTSTSIQVNINDDCIPLACGIEDIKGSISKAVTPNGDGINDFFTIGLNIECGFSYDVQVFNRWGNKVYESINYQNNWSGESDKAISGSNQLPSGTYYYIVNMRGSGLQPIQGYIFLGTK